MRSRAAACALLAALSLAACRRDGDGGPDRDGRGGERAGADPAWSAAWFGRVTPRVATPLHAPPAVFRVKGWNSRSSWIKLTSLAADGARVDAGQEVAAFELDAEEARDWIQKRILEAQADVDSARAGLASDVRASASDAALKELTAEKAELDTKKEGLVSARDLDLYKLAARSAAEERDASEALAKATRAGAASEVSFLEAKATDWRNGLGTYAAYERRMHVLAPHAGIVRYAYLNHRRRTVKPSDDMPCGTSFVSVAKDERLSVEILVPERALGALEPGDTVHARAADGGAAFDATVREVAPFPQEIGFLRGDDELPDAREKAFAVLADFDEAPASVQSGVEVRVLP